MKKQFILIALFISTFFNSFGQLNPNANSPLLSGASFTDQALNDVFFDQVNYRGAFGITNWTTVWTNFNPQSTIYPATTVTISAGDITTNTTWSAGNVYLLNGWVYVKAGTTLTIEPGTIIRGDKTNKGALIIEKGATINANGTASNPIVFTSNQAAGSRDYGDWGGIIILGNAVINVTGGSATIEGGVGSTYGGSNDADNSGTFKYVRIEFPGIAFSTNNEINGLTLGGVGSATQLDYIQVSYSGDDSFEWYGGTVNAKHLIAFRGWDDDFDTDFGFRGKVQFAVSLRDKNIADVSGSNGYESDNDGSGSTNAPFTNCVFSNFSLFGPKANLTDTIHTNYKRALHLRRNTKLNVFNSVFSGWPTGLFIDGTNTQANAIGNELKIKNCVLVGMNSFFASDFERSYFMDNLRNNDTMATTNMMMIYDAYNMNNPNFLPVYDQTGINDEKKSDINAYSYDNQIFINLTTTEIKTIIQLYNIQGQLIKTDSFENSKNIVIKTNSLKGIYILKVNTTEGIISKKIIL
jgi:hypothetical protein